MKYNSLLFLSFIITFACSSDPSQSAFPKRIPVDTRAEHQVDEMAAVLSAQIKKSIQATKEIEDKQNDGSLSYVTRDGVAEFVAESTTYYKEENKVHPLKTTIIYLTGDSVNVYWLANKVVLLKKDGYQYLFKNNVLISTLREWIVTEVEKKEQDTAKKIVSIAQKIISSPIPSNK